VESLLSEIEIRILGCLFEKEVCTPDYYPLTLNSLVNACNQKSNRDPVVSCSEKEVEKTLEVLREKALCLVVHEAGSRTTKYRHNLREEWHLAHREMAILCELMLRGPQTLGELKTRGSRMYSFNSLEEAEESLQQLMSPEKPLVIKLPRQTGRKENRYAHLLSGRPEIPADDQTENSTESSPVEKGKIEKLEQEILNLREELSILKKEFTDFKKQF
jgi:uncharacterized protein YceH (UPF0502 family)